MIKHSFYVDLGWIRAAYSLRDKMHYCTCLMTAFVKLQQISCRKKRDSFFFNNNSRRRVLNVEIYFPKKNVFILGISFKQKSYCGVEWRQFIAC